MVALAGVGAGALDRLGAAEDVEGAASVDPRVPAEVAFDPLAGMEVRELDRREVRPAAAALRAREPPARRRDRTRADGAARVLARLEAVGRRVPAHLQMAEGGLGCR